MHVSAVSFVFILTVKRRFCIEIYRMAVQKSCLASAEETAEAGYLNKPDAQRHSALSSSVNEKDSLCYCNSSMTLI